MAAKKKVAVRKKTGIANIQKEIAQQVGEIGDRIQAPSGNKISAKGKMFTFPDKTSVEGPMDIVVVDFVCMNAYYDSRYVEGETTPPACFAIGKNPDELVPSPNSPDPQADNCSDCPLNQWGSDGPGKACANTRKLAVVAPDDETGDTDIMVMGVSKTAVKSFDAFVGTVARKHATIPVGVVTEVDFDPSVDYPKLQFGITGDNPLLEKHYSRMADAAEVLATEPDVSKYGEQKKPARRVAKKKAAHRK